MAGQHKNQSNKKKRIVKGKVKQIERKKNTIDNSDHTKKNKGSIDVGVNKGIEIKKDKEVKGIGKGKGSEKDKNIIKVECMMEDQIINEDKICIDNII